MTRYAIIDDSDPGLVYSGNWTVLRAPLDAKTPEYNGTVHATNDPNATLSYNFTGTSIDLFGTIDSPGTHGYPNASFTVTPVGTGVPVKHLNQSGDIPAIEDLALSTSHLQLFKSGNISLGNHVMTLVADGVQQDGATFYFDFLRFSIPDSGVYDSIIVDDNDAQWAYSGNWVPGPHVGDYLYTGRETPHEGGRGELGFYGTEISIYGTLNGRYNADTPIAYINVDGEPPHTIVAQDITSQPLESGVPLRNQVIFSTSGMEDLGTNKRTVTVSVPAIIATAGSPASTPAPTISNPSWFLDYVVYGPYSAGSSSPPSTATLTSTSSPPTPPAGAIAGGVIGGLVFLLAVVVAAIFLWRRRKGQQIPVGAAVVEDYPRNMSESQGSRPLKGSTWTQNDSTAPSTSMSPRDGIDSHRMAGTHPSSRSSQPLESPRSPVHPEDEISGSSPTLPPREQDGGIRLASSSDYDSEFVNLRPPSYAPHYR